VVNVLTLSYVLLVLMEMLLIQFALNVIQHVLHVAIIPNVYLVFQDFII